MFGTLPIWPSRATVNGFMLLCFQSTFPLRVMLDCTEIHVQRPRSKVLNSEIYSHYKGNTTFKALIGLTFSPSGEVTFVSDLYTGSIPDKEIREWGILSLLEEGDEIIADKGFLIKDLLSETHVSLVIPPFLGPSGHFSPEEVRKTQAKARLRIHVERAIRRTKEYHKVLPMTLVTFKALCSKECQCNLEMIPMRSLYGQVWDLRYETWWWNLIKYIVNKYCTWVLIQGTCSVSISILCRFMILLYFICLTALVDDELNDKVFLYVSGLGFKGGKKLKTKKTRAKRQKWTESSSSKVATQNSQTK